MAGEAVILHKRGKDAERIYQLAVGAAMEATVVFFLRFWRLVITNNIPTIILRRGFEHKRSERGG